MNPHILHKKLKPVILALLAENEKMFGYEITQKIDQLIDNTAKATFGSIYPTLYVLENEGAVLTEVVNIGSRFRKYYFLA